MMSPHHHASLCQGGPDTDTRESGEQKSGAANAQLCFPKRAIVLLRGVLPCRRALNITVILKYNL